MSETQKALSCSRTFIEKQIKLGRLKPKYLGKKCYFLIDEVVLAMTDQPEDD
ncbi:hypothetical protein [Sporocytophaga myxococcoides]|nr:hypothetical protein [Sporocytophaga myxococcoides]